MADVGPLLHRVRRSAFLASVLALAAVCVGACAAVEDFSQSGTSSEPAQDSPCRAPAPSSQIDESLSAGRGAEAGCIGVFIGVSPDDPGYSPKSLASYDELILDLDAFTARDVAALRERGAKRIYSYLNIGAIEHSRSYYRRFADLAEAPYENWPDESWVDVRAPRWRDFLLDELAPALRGKGADGFFVDNTDAYGRTPSDEVFEALRAILSGLRVDGARVIVNGGDEFVGRLLDEDGAPAWEGAAMLETGVPGSAPIDGIAQEGVFTRIDDYERGAFSLQDEASRDYFLSRLEAARGAGLDILLIEYAKDPAAIDEVEAQCREHGYSCFISDGLMLDGGGLAVRGGVR